jgi:hypothetical protein
MGWVPGAVPAAMRLRPFQMTHGPSDVNCPIEGEAPRAPREVRFVRYAAGVNLSLRAAAEVGQQDAEVG